MKDKQELVVRNETPLRWPDGWPRTLIGERIDRKAWKKPIPEYQKAIANELSAMKVIAATITFNETGSKDPAVAVWYSMAAAEDVSWQTGLRIDNPMPTLAEIDSAYKELARKYHPDLHPDQPPSDLELFKKLAVYKEAARAYVLGTGAPKMESCIPMDVFSDLKQNLAGIRLFLSYLRGMGRLGMPNVVNRVMERTFRSALPQKATVVE